MSHEISASAPMPPYTGTILFDKTKGVEARFIASDRGSVLRFFVAPRFIPTRIDWPRFWRRRIDAVALMELLEGLTPEILALPPQEPPGA